MHVRHGANRLTSSQRLSRGLLVVPIALIATIALIDINSPETNHFGPFLVAAPALTASFAGPGLTGVVGVLAVAAQVAIADLHDGVIEARDRSGAFYPLVDRLAAWKGTGPDALVEHLHTDLLRYAGGHLDDDAVLIAITKTSDAVRGGAAASR
jgi:Stage II sporulation protein E (SpoIIE)